MRPSSDLAAHHPAPVAGRVLDLGTLLAILGQYRWLLAFCLIAALGGARIWLNTLPPVYTASAEVMLNNRETTIVNVPGVLGAPGGHDLAASEERVLTSQRLLQQVIDRLHLDRDPEFNRTLAPRDASWQVRARQLADPLLKLASDPPPDRAVAQARAALAVIDRFRDAVTISAVPRTRSITVAVTSNDPAKAALIANTLADLYIVDQLETKFDATRRASAWLNQRLAELKGRVEASEAAVVGFRADQALGPGQGRDLTAQQIAELNSELIVARAALAEAEARASQVENRIATGGIAAAANVLSSELILTLRTNLAALIRREAELSTRYGPKHPKIIDVRAEIADTRGAIGREVRKIVEGLRNDVAVAHARADALERSLGALEDKSVELSRTAVHLNQLEREAAADREIYENFMARVRETKEQENLQSADARILSLAIPPLEPTGPNRRKIVLLATALGLFTALGVIILNEATARSVRAAPELTEAFGLPVVSILPRLGGLAGRRLLRRLRAAPAGPLAEAGRGLRSATLLSSPAGPPRVVAVTSSVGREDAPATALMLAHAAAQAGARTLLVDADIRRPRYCRLLGSGSRGLVGLLDGADSAAAAIVQPPGAAFRVLPGLRPQGGESDLMTHDRFARMIARLRPDFDLIVIDAPPVLTGTDAAAIARAADAVLYSVRWQHTPRDAVRQGIGRLSDLGVQPLGFVLTDTRLAEEARHAQARFGAGWGYLAARAG